MPAILRFPPAPNFLEWLKEMSADLDKFQREKPNIEAAKRLGKEDKLAEFEAASVQIKDIYSYFRWSHAYHNSELGSDERLVAEGLLHKFYHRILRITEAHPAVIEQIVEAERMLKESNEEIKRRKAKKT